MCNDDMQPGPGPEVVAALKELAGKGPGRHGVMCGSGGTSTEYRLDSGEVRSRCLPTTFEDTARSRLAEPVPELEGVLAGIDIAIRDVSRGGSSTICASLLEKIDAALPASDCPQCGKPMERHRKTGKVFASRPGPVEVVRTYCRCRGCGAGFFPLDSDLGPEGQTATPGSRTFPAVGRQTQPVEKPLDGKACERKLDVFLAFVGAPGKSRLDRGADIVARRFRGHTVASI